MLRLLTRLVLLFAVGFFAPGEAAARAVTRAGLPDVLAEKLASWGSAPELAVLRQAAAMQAAGMQQASASHSYESAPVYSLAAETVGAQAGDHIVLGLANQGLEETAAQVGGRTLLNDPQWMST